MRETKRIIAFLMAAIVTFQSSVIGFAQENADLIITEMSEMPEEIISETEMIESEENPAKEIMEEMTGELSESAENSVEEMEAQEEIEKSENIEDTDATETSDEVEDVILTEEEKEALFLQTVSYEILTNKTDGTNYINVLGLLENIEPVTLLVIPEAVNVTIEETEERVAIRSIKASAFKKNADIKKIICDAKLDSIGNYAFQNCTSVESVEFNSDVEKIGNYAFEYCTSLSTVKADFTLHIGERVFYECEKLNTVQLKMVQTIGNSAFRYCDVLKEVDLTECKELVSIGTYAFANNMQLTKALLPQTEAEITLGNYIFNGCTQLTEVTLGGVKKIPDFAFYDCRALESLNLENVTQIGNSAFERCYALTSVSGNDVISIGTEAFYDCEALESLELKLVQTIGNSAFRYCDVLKEVDLTKCKELVSIGTYAFANNTQLLKAALPETEAEITLGNNAFYGNSGLTEVQLGSVMKIPSSCFDDCINLESIHLDNVTQIGNNAFEGCRVLRTVSANDVVTIGSYAFSGCSILESVQLQAIESIGDSAFRSCAALTEMDFTECQNLTTIGTYVFDRNVALRSVRFPNNEQEIVLRNYVFNGCNQLTEVGLGSVSNIPNNCFYNCTLLENINLAKITQIGSNAFDGCSSLKTVSANNVVTVGSYAFRNCTSLENVQVKAVETINSYAFRYCSSLESIDLGENLTTVGSYAFEGASALKEVILPQSTTSLGNSAFYNCAELTKVNLGSVTQIPSNCLVNCKKLETVIVGESVTAIGNNAFSNCTMLEKIEMPGELTSIAQYAFQNCSSLDNLKLKGTVTTIPRGMFDGCKNLENFEYEGTITVISDYAFQNCNVLATESVQKVIQNAVTIGAYAFSGCNGLEEVQIPESVTSLGNYTFYNCTNLKNAEITGTDTILGNYLFSGCPLENIVLPENITKIPTGLFRGAKMTKFMIPETITIIGEYAFYDCSNLQEIIIPESVVTIDTNAFYNCSSLREIRLPEGLTRLGNNVFSNCTNLETIFLPKKLIRVGTNVFSNDKALTNIVFHSGMEKVPAYLFYGSCFEEIEIPDTIRRIDKQAFYGNRYLTKVEVKNENVEYLTDDIFSKNNKLTLYGYKNSTTQKFAQKNNISFSHFSNIDVEEIRLNTTQAVLLPEDELQLKITYVPVYATENKKITYTSSDETIVKVDENGLVKAVKEGSAVITATSRNGLTSVAHIEVVRPEKPQSLYAITNVQKTLKDVIVSGFEKWSFVNPQTGLIAQELRPLQQFEAVYLKDNGSYLTDALSVSVCNIDGIAIEGDSFVSLDGNDYLTLNAMIETTGAELEDSRYEAIWSVSGSDCIISDRSKESVSVIGTEKGKNEIVLEVYLLDEEGKRYRKEENVTYFKAVKEIEVVETPVMRGMYFTQTGLPENMIEADVKKGISGIHMLPEKVIKSFTIKAMPYSYDLENQLKPMNKKIIYSSSDKKIAVVKMNKSGEAVVQIKKPGIVQIIAKDIESGYTESIMLSVVDYMPRLSADVVTMNLYQETPAGEIGISPSYEKHYQCKIVEDSIEIVYRNKKGIVTESEFSIVKEEETDTYTIGIKEGKSLKKGKKKVYIAVKVKGSVTLGSETYYIPLTISLVQKKPSVSYQQTAIKPFYKDSLGSLEVISKEAEIASVEFIPNTKEGKAGLETIKAEDSTNKLEIVPNEVMKTSYTDKFNNKGSLVITFKGYKENAAITVKNFKLAADKTKPTITTDYSTVHIYTDLSSKAEVKLYNDGEILKPEEGYKVFWKNEKAEKAGLFSFVLKANEGILELETLEEKSGKLELMVESDKWNDSLPLTIKAAVKKAPQVSCSLEQITLNLQVKEKAEIPVSVKVDGNNSYKIKNIKLASTDYENAEVLKHIVQTYDEENGQLKLSVKDTLKLENDYAGNFDLITTVTERTNRADVTKKVKVKITLQEPAVTVKTSKSIDSVKRDTTYVSGVVNLQNITGTVKNVSLIGESKEHFTVTYTSGKNKDNFIIKAKNSTNENPHALIAGKDYLFKMQFELDNGLTLLSDEFKVNVKQSKIKAKSLIKSYNLYGSLEGKAYGKVLQFALNNSKTEKIEAVKLNNFEDVFTFDYIEDGKGLLYIKDIKAFAAKKFYGLKFDIYTTNSMIGSTASTASVTIKNRPIKISAYDEENRVFALDTEKLIYDDETGTYGIIEQISKIEGKVNKGYKVTNASYSIMDDRNHELISGEFEAANTWEIDKLAFLFGQHRLVLSGEISGEGKFTEEYIIYNMSELNVGELDQNDDDGDGLLNYLEDYYDSDREDADTDDDGLNDYLECMEISTNPCMVDTDGNGVTDFDEDADADGLTNGEEVDLGTLLYSTDSDIDTLSDYEEVKKYHTNPVLADTDADGVDDNVELKIGSDPLVAEELFCVAVEVEGNVENGAVPSVEIPDLSAQQVETLSVTPVTAVDNSLLSSSIPGYMGAAYDFEVKGTFEEATISFEYNEDLLTDSPGAVPTIYYYNEETQILEEVPGQVIEDGIVSVAVTHFSTYILLNKTEYEKVWDTEVRPPSEDGSGVQSIDIAFVIDDSGSMASNDPDDLRISLTRGFLDKLRDVDRASVVSFTASCSVLSPFTNDKQAVLDSLVAYSNGGTNIQKGIRGALEQFAEIKTENDSSISKIMFVLTDGDDGIALSGFDECIQEANENNIKIFTVGFGDVREDKLQYIAEACGGKYYYASSAADLEDCYQEVEDEVVADVTDSNGDGISDYYTEKICNGELTTSTGYNPFAGMTFKTIQANADADEDGLLNGEEIMICVDSRGVYLKMNSDPLRKYSDLDPYTDYEEVRNMGTDPMYSEHLVEEEDVDFLLTHKNFNADNYRRQYNDKWGTKVGLWLGNIVSGNIKTLIARDMLLAYMSDLNEGESAYCEEEMLIETVYSWMCGVKDNISAYMDPYSDIKEEAGLDLLEVSCKKINSGIDELVELCGKKGKESKINQIATKAAKQYDELVSKLPSLKKTIEVVDKAGEVLSVVGYVVDGIDIITGSYSYYTKIAAQMEMLNENIYILELVISNTDNSFVRSGAIELKNALWGERELKLSTAVGALTSAGVTITMEIINGAVASIVPWGTAVVCVLGFADYVFQIGDMSERFVQIYTIAETAYILANDLSYYFKYKSPINYKGIDWYVLSEYEYMKRKHRIRNLASARYLEEITLLDAEDNMNWFSKWIYKEDWYSERTIRRNMKDAMELRSI